jgi:hypothetical protein
LRFFIFYILSNSQDILQPKTGEKSGGGSGGGGGGGGGSGGKSGGRSNSGGSGRGGGGRGRGGKFILAGGGDSGGESGGSGGGGGGGRGGVGKLVLAVPARPVSVVNNAIEPSMLDSSTKGYDESIFVKPEEIKPQYICGICNCVLCKPVQCKEGHACCAECLNAWLARNKTCPTCREPLSEDNLSKNRCIEDIIDAMTAYCSNHRIGGRPTKTARGNGKVVVESTGGSDGGSSVAGAGCEWTGPLRQRKAHVENDCMFAVIACSHQGCNIRVVRSSLADHQSQCGFKMVVCDDCSEQVPSKTMAGHKSTCLKAQVQCGLDCGASFCRGEKQQHKVVCPLQPVPCVFECHGCSAVVLRRDYAAHQVDASSEHAALAALLSEKIAALETAAAADRARFDAQLAALEAEVESQRM